MRVPYDDSYDPPMPVLPVHVSGVDAEAPGILLHAIVDTGADCSVVPESTARVLRLPIVDMISVSAFAGEGKPRPVYAARLRVANRSLFARVLAAGDEPLLGRDVLNKLTMQLDGPGEQLKITAPRRKTRSKSKM